MGTISIDNTWNLAKLAEMVGVTDPGQYDSYTDANGTLFLTVYSASDDELALARWEYVTAVNKYNVDATTATPEEIQSAVYSSHFSLEIDKAAERARQRYITDGAGQAMVYQEKADQAADFVAAGYPADTSPYPYIEADMAALSLTKEQAADEILNTRSSWISISATIEQTRLSGKKAVRDASTQTERETAADTAIATLDAL